MRNTKIVCTLGPASDSPEMLRSLIVAGVEVFRLNASHSSQEEHLRRIQTLRAAAEELGAICAILLDLQGPKIRLGTFEGGRATLVTGQTFTITTEDVPGSAERASTNYQNLARDVRRGDRILLADGTVTLEVKSTDGVSAVCEVIAGGEIGDRKGINLPGVDLSLPSLTDKDLRDLEFGLEAGVDLFALSFIRRAQDVQIMRAVLEAKSAGDIPLVAKIEKPQAWENLDEILEASDGVMVARGDLGVEMDLARVPYIQKTIIERARKRGKFVITATQMLESMVKSPMPTRAEVSDVANAIYDGTDAVMLSAETSVGQYPVEAVRMMARIADETESLMGDTLMQEAVHGSHPTGPEIVADAAMLAARAAKVAAIAVFTYTGSNARLVARYRNRAPIYVFTPVPETARRLAPVFGLRPIITGAMSSTDEMLRLMERVSLEKAWLKEGDSVIVLAGQPFDRPAKANLMKLHIVGDSLAS